METETQTPNEPVNPPIPETKPTITPGTKMARRGFKSAAAVEAEGLARGEKPPTSGDAIAEPASAETEAEALPSEFTFESPNEPSAPVIETPREEVVAAAEAPGKYKIGDKSFKTQDEAWSYAEELERQQLANDAFRQGLEAAQNTQVSNTNLAPAAPVVPEVMPDEYYTNPAGYLAKREAELLNRATAQAVQQATLRANHERTMSKFWSDFPDLGRNDATRALTEAVLNANFASLKNVDTEKALKIVAEKARGRLKELGVTTLPTKTLISNTKPAASVGSGQTVTRPKADDKPLSFVEQSKKLKASRRAKRARR